MLDLAQDRLFVHAKQVAAFLGINHSGDFVWDDGYRLDNIGDGGGALDGIVLRVLQHDTRLEIDEVGLILLDVLLDLDIAVCPDKSVGVIFGRQR